LKSKGLSLTLFFNITFSEKGDINMAEKLPPPYLEATIDAQIGNSLTIPFELNRAVGINRVNGMKARIKTIATNRIIAPALDGDCTASTLHSGYDATFTIDPDTVDLIPGQYYKIQLAFVEKGSNVIGHYSTVGVFKYTNLPVISIDKLSDGETGNLYTYTANYSNTDVTEKVYSYRFYVTQNIVNTLIADSGVLLHNSSKDTEPGQSSDTWTLNQQLTPGIQYTLTYAITTNNGYKAEKAYTIVNNELSDSDLLRNCFMEPELDFDNGSIIVKLRTTKPISRGGGFVLSRSDSRTNY
jgi:hypothetical protein